MGIRITGLEELKSRLADMQHRAQALDGTHEVTLSELFHSEFMLLNTDFDSIEAMFAASGYDVKSQEDFAAIPDEPWDIFVPERTRFQSWREMLSSAAKDYFQRRL